MVVSSRGGGGGGRNVPVPLLNCLDDTALNSVSCNSWAADGVGVPGHEL